MKNLTWFRLGTNKKASEEADPISILLKDMFPFKCTNGLFDFGIKVSHWIAPKC